MKPFQTMPCRVKSYEATLNGYEKTDTYLIAYNISLRSSTVCTGFNLVGRAMEGSSWSATVR